MGDASDNIDSMETEKESTPAPSKTTKRKGGMRKGGATGKKKAFVSTKPKPAKLVSDIEKKSKRHRKKNYKNYSLYIHKLIKRGVANQPDLTISKRAMECMNCYTSDMLGRLCRLSSSLAVERGTRTMNDRDVAMAVKMLLPGQLATQAAAEGMRACENYDKSFGEKKATGGKKGPKGGKGKEKVKAV